MHEKIREDPMPEKKERTKPDEARTWKQQKLTYEQRKAALKVRACAVRGACLGTRLVLWARADVDFWPWADAQCNGLSLGAGCCLRAC